MWRNKKVITLSLMNMRNFVTVSLFFISITGFSQSLIKASVIDQWPQAGQIVTPPPIYDRVTSHVFVFNNDGWIELFRGKEFDRQTRRKIGIKRGEEPDYLNVSIRFKHPELKGGLNENGEDIGISIPLFSYDQREEVQGTDFQSFQNTMFLNDVKTSSIVNDVMGRVEVAALSSNDSEKFWLEVAKISADFGKSAVSLALGNPTAIGEITNKLTGHIDNGIENLNGLTSDPIKRNYSTWIKLLSRNVNNQFDEIVTGMRLYEVNWSKLDYSNYNKLSQLPYPVTSENTPTVDGVRELIENDTLKVPLILIIEVRTKTRIDIRNPQLTEDYNNWASKEYLEYTQQKQFSLVQEYYEDFLLAYSSSNALENFLINQGKENEKHFLYEAINYAYKYQVNSNNSIKLNEEKKSDSDLKPVIEALTNRYNSLRDLLNSKFSQSSNYDLREAGNIVTVLTKPLSGTQTSLESEQFIGRLEQYERIINLSKLEEAKLSDSYVYSKQLRQELENNIYNELLLKTVGEKRTIAFYEDIRKNYAYCKVCVNSAVNKINEINSVSLATAQDKLNKLSTELFNKFNVSRDSLTLQFPEVDVWINNLDEVSQAKYKPFYNRMTKAIPVWIDLVKKDENEIFSQNDIKIVNEWTSKLESAMDDIIIGSVFFSNLQKLVLPSQINGWFEKRNDEVQ